MASMRRIAAQTGVSVATVSRVLNNHPHVDDRTRQRVLAAADSARYVTISQRTQAVIGLVYPEDIVRADYGGFDLALLSGLLEGVNEQRYDVKIISIRRDKSPEESYSQFFARKGLRAVVLRTFEHTREVVRAIASERYPVVVVADRFEDANINFVCANSFDESYRAVRHLIDLGHRRISLVAHSVADTDHNDRRSAYVRAHTDAGVEIIPDMIVTQHSSAESGANAISHLMGLRQPATAVFITNPLSTVGALRRCLELGIRVPQDLSIIGFDDSDVRLHTYPVCSAVVQDARSLGIEAARWLTRVTSGAADTPPELRIVHRTRFEINQTTAQPPADLVRFLPDGTRIAAALAEPVSSYSVPQVAVMGREVGLVVGRGLNQGNALLAANGSDGSQLCQEQE